MAVIWFVNSMKNRYTSMWLIPFYLRSYSTRVFEVNIGRPCFWHTPLHVHVFNLTTTKFVRTSVAAFRLRFTSPQGEKNTDKEEEKKKQKQQIIMALGDFFPPLLLGRQLLLWMKSRSCGCGRSRCEKKRKTKRESFQTQSLIDRTD